MEIDEATKILWSFNAQTMRAHSHHQNWSIDQSNLSHHYTISHYIPRRTPHHFFEYHRRVWLHCSPWYINGIIWRSMAGQAWWLLNEWIGWWRRIDEWWNDYWSWSMEMTWRFERGRNKIVKEISVFHDAHCICAQRCFVLRLLWYHPFLRTACSLFCAYIRATIRNNDSLSTRFNNGLWSNGVFNFSGHG